MITDDEIARLRKAIAIIESIAGMSLDRIPRLLDEIERLRALVAEYKPYYDRALHFAEPSDGRAEMLPSAAAHRGTPGPGGDKL